MLTDAAYLVGDDSFADEGAAALSEHYRVLGNSVSLQEAIRRIHEWRPSMVIVDGDGLGDPVEIAQGIAQAAKAVPESPTRVFLAAYKPTANLVRLAIGAGVDGVLQRPIALEELHALLGRDGEPSRTRTLPVQPGAKAQGAAEPRRPTVLRLRQQIIAVYSPKGGTGATTVAMGLAAAYRQIGVERVLLVEADPYGDFAVHFPGLRRHVGLWRGVDGDGAAMGWPQVEQLVHLNEQAAFWVLPGPPNVVAALEIDAPTMQRVIQAARRHFDVVIIDCGHDMTHDATLVTLRNATRVYVIAPPELPGLNRVAGRGRAGELLVSDMVGVSSDLVQVVINRVPRRPDVDLTTLVQQLPFRLAGTIPEDPSVKFGALPVHDGPRGSFSREIKRIVSSGAELGGQPPKRWLGRLLGRGG